MMNIDGKSYVCGECTKFLGMGDWDLCCKEKHDPKEYPLGFLCYEDSPACDKFVPVKTVTEKQFIKQFCKFCGTQRCEGINTEFFNGCIHRFYLKDYKKED